MVGSIVQGFKCLGNSSRGYLFVYSVYSGVELFYLKSSTLPLEEPPPEFSGRVRLKSHIKPSRPQCERRFFVAAGLGLREPVRSGRKGR
jgi:hypothetical protein